MIICPPVCTEKLCTDSYTCAPPCNKRVLMYKHVCTGVLTIADMYWLKPCDRCEDTDAIWCGQMHQGSHCVLMCANMYSCVPMCTDVHRCVLMCIVVYCSVLMLIDMMHPPRTLKIPNGRRLQIKKSRPIWVMQNLRKQGSGEIESVSYSKNLM